MVVVIMCMTMRMIISMAVIMGVTMRMAVVMGMIVGVIMAMSRSNPFHMVMMTFLDHAHFILKAQGLFPVFTEAAIHIVGTVQNLPDPIRKAIQNQGVVIQVRRLDKFDIRMGGGNFVRIVIDPVDQDTGEQEIREDNDPLVTQPGSMFETRLNQREGDA